MRKKPQVLLVFQIAIKFHVKNITSVRIKISKQKPH